MNSITVETDKDQLAKQLWALGDPIRLQILEILPREPDCENACNVSTIAERIGLAQPTASHHLRVLRQAGIVENKKMCRDMIYWLPSQKSLEICETLQQLLRV